MLRFREENTQNNLLQQIPFVPSRNIDLNPLWLGNLFLVLGGSGPRTWIRG